MKWATIKVGTGKIWDENVIKWEKLFCFYLKLSDLFLNLKEIAAVSEKWLKWKVVQYSPLINSELITLLMNVAIIMSLKQTEIAFGKYKYNLKHGCSEYWRIGWKFTGQITWKR